MEYGRTKLLVQKWLIEEKYNVNNDISKQGFSNTVPNLA